jgi:hypothetical protein
MAASKWNVWSVNSEGTMALVVDEGTRKHCEEAAARRNESLARLKMGGRFEALPGGQKPGDMG